MNRQQLLLVQLAEELSEVQVSISKAIRFGLEDGYPNSNTTNADDIAQEFQEAMAIFSMLENTDNFVCMSGDSSITIQEEKIRKVNEWLKYSEEKGVLTDKSRL